MDFVQYQQLRQDLINKCENITYGNMTFNEEEQKANDKFTQIVNETRYNYNEQFYMDLMIKEIDSIKKEKLYEVLQKVPKGSLHHIHIDCCFNPEWFIPLLLQHSTYIDKITNKLRYVHKNQEPGKDEILLKDFQNNLYYNQIYKSPNDSEFKKFMLNLITIGYDQYSQNLNMWHEFSKVWENLFQAIFHKDILHDFLVNVFCDFYHDGVDDIETRHLFGGIIDQYGNHISMQEEILIFQQSIQDAQQKCPHLQVRIIAQALKLVSLQENLQYLEKVFLLAIENPNLIVGFDMVQEEDTSPQMIQLYDIFKRKQELEKIHGFELPFVFHGGESLKRDNTNLFDCILLKSRRIGHGLNLSSHAYLIETIKQDNICIEINPISNQILQYIKDMRMHPLKTYLGLGIKCSINCDDPGYFKFQGVSYDWFCVVLALQLNLKDVKKLCLNSIECSLNNPFQKQKYFQIWNKKWNEFILNLNTI